MTKKLISDSYLLPFFLLFSLTSFSPSDCQPETNGMFVFGSSLVDNGNNNFINKSGKSDYMPYGIDFPQGPTGRFSNGMNMIDAICQQLKLPLIPAFLHPNTNGRHILHGVNYASGSSGILDGINPPSIGLNNQIQNFEVTLKDLRIQLQSNDINSVSSALSNYLFVLGAGGNDLRLYYFGGSNTSHQDIANKLSDTLSGQIQKLYSLGARKFVLISVYPLGCIPSIRKSLPDPKVCSEGLEQLAVAFNTNMKSLVDSLKPEMPGSNLVYVNSYKTIKDVLADPISEGFTDTTNPCCEVGSNGTGVGCKWMGNVCKNRRGYVFFDGLHTSEAMNVVIARRAYSSMSPTEAYPFNLQQLAKL